MYSVTGLKSIDRAYHYSDVSRMLLLYYYYFIKTRPTLIPGLSAYTFTYE